VTFTVAVIAVVLIWRYYKHHEEQLLSNAERDLALLRQRSLLGRRGGPLPR
jgi:hypothetical protein